MDEAPYEILGNNMLSFEEMLRLKRTEDILEKYFNAHRMDETVEYVIAREFATPFDFYEAFGDYWEEQGWGRMGHQLIDLFERLDQFLEARQSPHLPVARQLMKFNYLLQVRSKRYAGTWEDEAVPGSVTEAFYAKFSDKNWTAEHFPSLVDLTGKELRKYTMLERFTIDLGAVLDSLKSKNDTIVDILEKDSYILFYYPPTHTGDKARVEYFIVSPDAVDFAKFSLKTH